MDMGLLGGIGQGITSGLESYRTERNYQDQKRRENEDRDAKRQALGRSIAMQDLEAGKTRAETAKLMGGIKDSATENQLKTAEIGLKGQQAKKLAFEMQQQMQPAAPTKEEQAAADKARAQEDNLNTYQKALESGEYNPSSKYEQGEQAIRRFLGVGESEQYSKAEAAKKAYSLSRMTDDQKTRLTPAALGLINDINFGGAGQNKETITQQLAAAQRDTAATRGRSAGAQSTPSANVFLSQLPSSVRGKKTQLGDIIQNASATEKPAAGPWDMFKKGQ